MSMTNLKINRQHRSITTYLLGALLALGSFAVAQGFPNQPIEIVVPWAAGGNADQQARILAQASEGILGVPVYVTNKPGGSTIPGVVEALAAPADGYTLIWVSIPTVATVPVLADAPFSETDLSPLANVSENTLVLYVRDDSDWYTLDQLVAAGQGRPLSVAVNEINGLPHLAAVGLMLGAGLDFRFISTGSSAGSVVSLLGGNVDLAVAHEPQAFSHGKGLRALAVFEPERSSYLPLVPTAAEYGFPVYGYVRDSVAISAKAPPEVQKVLADAFAQAIDSAAFTNAFLSSRIKKLYLNPQDTVQLWSEASESYTQIIESLLGE